jgi:hypothetical protein
MLEYRVQYYKLVAEPSKGFILEPETETRVTGSNEEKVKAYLRSLQDRFRSVNDSVDSVTSYYDNDAAKVFTATNSWNEETAKMVITKVDTINLDDTCKESTKFVATTPDKDEQKYYIAFLWENGGISFSMEKEDGVQYFVDADELLMSPKGNQRYLFTKEEVKDKLSLNPYLTWGYYQAVPYKTLQ